MTPIFDTDVVLLEAVALASKRKPAELAEVVTALAVADKRLPAQAKLLDAFVRLGNHGLLLEQQGCYTLTIAAQAVLGSVPKRCKPPERVVRIKEQLAEYQPAAGIGSGTQAPTAALEVLVAAYEASLPPPTKTEKAVLKREQSGAPRRTGAPARGPLRSNGAAKPGRRGG